MMRIRLGGVLIAIAALLSPLVLSATATADSAHPSTLMLRVKTTPGHLSSTVWLHCAPPGGNHPHAITACGEITLATGNFDNLPGNPQIVSCTLEHRPVVVSAKGTWHGKPVRWSAQFSNRCSMHAETGSVFDF